MSATKPNTGNNEFAPARAKLWIASVDDPSIEVIAQYNPKELQIDKQVPWNDPKGRDNANSTPQSNPSTQVDVEYNGVAKRSMSIELFFDGYESGRSVEPEVRLLDVLSTVQDPSSSDEDKRRPHHCLVGWGAGQSSMRPFLCVIESASTKYTMFNELGEPLRATCTLKLKEAERVSLTRQPNTRYSIKEWRPPG